MNEINLKGLNPTDRVFECDECLVKIRLEKKEIVQNGKIFGPEAISLKFTASVCDKNGKAIPRARDRYCILPKTVTLPVMQLDPRKNLGKEINDILEPLIRQAVDWHMALDASENFVKAWEKTKPASKKTSA